MDLSPPSSHPAYHPAAASSTGTIVPRYLTAQDYPWLDALLNEYARFVGRRRFELDQHLEVPLRAPVHPSRVRLARQVLDREYTDRTDAAVVPSRARQSLYRAAAELSRGAALLRASGEFGVSLEMLEEALFADLPGQRRLMPLAAPLSSAELALKINHAMVRSLLERATRVRIRADGDVRGLVRAIKLRGLICTAEPDLGRQRLRLDISGPLALFRRTLVYGRALASLLPRVARCASFELTALCAQRGAEELRELTLRSGDPIWVADALPAYDSKLEERFARDFLRLTDDFDLIREPDAIPVRGGFIFPDFLVRHRRLPEREAWIEIIGFWTPEYLAGKLARLREAQLENVILCIDEQRNCSEEELPPQARVVRYRRRVPADIVFQQLNGLLDSPPARPMPGGAR